MKKRGLLVILILFTVLLCGAKTFNENILIKEKLVDFKLDNIKVEKVTFVDNKNIEVNYKQKDLIVEQSKHTLTIKSPKKKAKIWLELPMDKRYHTQTENGNLYIDAQGVTVITDDGQKFVMDGKVMEIYADGSEIYVYEDGSLMIIDESGEKVTINSDGIISEENLQEEDENLTNFWGKALSAVIGVAVRTVMNAVGETPEEVAATALNEYFWDHEFEDFIDEVGEKGAGITGNRNYKEETRNISAAGVEDVSVDNFNGKIEIKTGSYNEIEVFTRISSEKEKNLDNVEIIYTEGKHLKIKSKALKLLNKCGVKYQIKLPAGIKVKELISTNGNIVLENCEGDLNVETSNGSIEIENHLGDLLLKTTNGSVDLENIDGSADIRTTNGRIEAESITGWLDAETSNAKIMLENCPKLEKVQTSNGNIYAEIINLEKDLKLITTNSTIKVGLHSNLNCRLDADTSNGRIEINNLTLNIQEQSKSKLKAEMNDGGYLLEMQTTNSNIHIYNK